MTDDVSENTEVENAADDVAENATDVDAAKKSAPEESDAKGADKAEDGKAKEADADAEKGKSDDEEGDGDSGELEYSAEDFALPEGMEIDEAMMVSFMEVAKEANLPKDQAEKLVNLYAAKQQEAVDAQIQQWDETRQDWQKQTKADKEIGGKALNENMALAQKALAEFGTKELKEFGEQYGWADHPEYIRMLVRIGKTLSEDQSANSQGDSQQPIENRWYGSGG